MQKDPHKKRFLNVPKYPGGSQAFKEFILGNLHYPDDAISANVEGSVVVEYEITDEGKVINPRILKGVGYGCDEEALRLVSLLQFEKVRNRGVRLRLTTKTTIHFKLPGVRLTYTTTEKEPTQPPTKTGESGSYEYTITW
jgi:TonB family protein